MRKIATVWGIVIVIIFACLTIFGFLYQGIKEYHFLEDKMEKYAKQYVEKKYKDKKLAEDLKITLDELKEFKPKAKYEVKDDECDGYVEVSKSLFGYSYKAVLECDKYSKGKKI